MLASLVANVPGNVAISNAWIGLDYTSYMGSTNWLDGTPITYSKESDTPGTYPLCIVITGTGTWRAFSCNDEREYICKKLGGMFKLYQISIKITVSLSLFSIKSGDARHHILML